MLATGASAPRRRTAAAVTLAYQLHFYLGLLAGYYHQHDDDVLDWSLDKRLDRKKMHLPEKYVWYSLLPSPPGMA